MKRILAIWLPNWPVQRFLADRPEPPGPAVVLYERDARDGDRVKACSGAAFAQGVRPAMPLAEAQALLLPPDTAQRVQSGRSRSMALQSRVDFSQDFTTNGTALESHATNNPRHGVCSPPVSAIRLIERHDAQRDRETLVKLAGWCERFSPIVGLDQADEPDTLLLDVSGLGVLFGGEAGLARQVVEAFRADGWEVRVAVADTVSAAWAFAHFDPLGARSEITGLNLDRGGTSLSAAKGVVWQSPTPFVPQGVPPPCAPLLMRGHLPARSVSENDACCGAITGEPCLIPPGDTNAWQVLPIAALRLPERTTERLRRLGILQLAQLAQLPRASLSRRFGKELVACLDRIAGAAAEVIVAYKSPGIPAADRVLEHPTTRRDALEYVLAGLFQHVAQQLIAQGRGAWRLDCRLLCPNRQAAFLRVSLYQPTADAQHWLTLARMQLETLVLPDAVAEIHVAAEATAPCARRQGELFAGAARDDPAQLSVLIERLSNRLGRAQVVRPELQPEAEVERAYRCVPLAGGEPAETPRRPVAADPGLPPLCRPLWIFQPPEPIEVVGLAGDGPPALFHYGQPHRVVRCFGPERIETGWWRGASSRRDYYRVETESGQRLWLFRRLQDQRWFLHGEFR